MNERIKELAEQAGIEFVYDPTETPMRAFVECWEDDLEKFAELIVRECAAIASNTNLEDVDGGDSAVLFAAREQILEHFGVKE